MLNTNNSKEKNVITVELSKDEKIVYSQLGINPLIKLGKKYLTNNHLILLEDDKNKEKDLENKKSINKISSKKENKKAITSNSIEDLEVVLDETEEVNPENESPKITIDKEEIEKKDEIDNSRRKRRRSSASIE